MVHRQTSNRDFSLTKLTVAQVECRQVRFIVVNRRLETLIPKSRVGAQDSFHLAWRERGIPSRGAASSLQKLIISHDKLCPKSKES